MSDEHVPPWLIRCHWCGRNYIRRWWPTAPFGYHWRCWWRSKRTRMPERLEEA